MPHLDDVDKVHGSSATLFQLTSYNAYQNPPMTITTYQIISNNTNKYVGSKNQEMYPK